MKQLIAWALVAATWGHANATTGNELLQEFQQNRVMAVHYVRGSSETWALGLSAWRQAAEKTGTASQVPPGFCVPVDVTLGQTADTVKTYLEKNPQLRVQGANVLVLVALREAWPCK